ncbi:MAG: CAP domain-containing protein [Aquaticitalea sp.]
MKTIKLLSLLTLMAIMSISCSTDEVATETLDSSVLVATPAAKTIEIEIMELINAHRIGMGLNPLQNLSIIKSVAFTHTDYMVVNNQVNHDNFYVRKNSLIQNAGAISVSENVAYGYNTAEGVVNAWLNSENHRSNIEGDFTDFDLSAEQNAEGRWYYTNMFMKK